jgi:hypothetical protein
MNIITKSDIFTPENIAKIEEMKQAKYVCETCLKGKHGWVNNNVAVFWNKDPANIPAGGSAWFGLFYDVMTGNLMITNAISATEHIIHGVLAENGDVIYSKYRHDYRVSPDGSVFIDGGRDYYRGGLLAPERHICLKIVEGDLVAVPWPNGQVTY